MTESDEGLVAGQSEVATPVPSKEPKTVQEGDSSPEVGLFTDRCGAHQTLSSQMHMAAATQAIERDVPSCDRAL